ncbi:hypothetical protein C9F11_46935 (plasmid) [Streptomyces sp. YIM 121038]|uniref:DUF5988 family protein n=1 Tax=Streptomyces sp. YIM 121038 TaxID=2136401 RepID=UPI0011101E4B|nr:DUF5988 family protein [Streptomyces sp. YIM 121038]QCX82934.1 hypothetical protein C9F11_46935 [Streptomyces sp. YIM 121038]
MNESLLCHVEDLVALEGGPVALPSTTALTGNRMTDKVSLIYLNGREHYVRTCEVREVGGRLLPVFRWSYSTKIAE